MSAKGAHTHIKFCGMTSAGDLQAGVEAGADAIGVILTESPRRISLERARELKRALPDSVELVAVVADPPDDLLRAVRELGAIPQLHGDEPPAAQPYIKAFHVEAGTAFDADEFERFAARHPDAVVLVDSRTGSKRGGTGIPFDWTPLREPALRRRIIVSGGLTPENVGACVRAVRPYGVDVRSGIESGERKDRGKMAAFVQAVREADAST